MENIVNIIDNKFHLKGIVTIEITVVSEYETTLTHIYV
uniref:Uncharacterized protein n=1 Tax=Staphylococcus epidermidis TaxID=1282 RepID=A0A6B9V0L6_STAEP|nr:hypothetical protein [Staphylococcus epidermidis]